MNKQNPFNKPICCPFNKPIHSPLTADVEGFVPLAALALDLRWSWTHATDEVWRRLDPALWECMQNPWGVLQTVSNDKVTSVLADPSFCRKVDDQLRAKRQAAETPGWFQKRHSQSPLKCVAYFSMEYMLGEALPTYSGGLGNVADGQLKAASDLGVPVVGVGRLYQQGYFHQVIDQNGAQPSLYLSNDPGQLPITPLRQPDGERVRLEIALSGYSVWLRAWLVQVGRVELYLLDSNDLANFPARGGITSELYHGGLELRFVQEILLGIGGWRLRAALDIKPDACHLNEGHAAFAVLERARSFMRENARPREVALAATREGNLFTTHTAVAAGFDPFTPVLIERYLRDYAGEKRGISVRDLLALRRQNPDNMSESFNMAYLVARGSESVNDASRLHGKVSRQVLAPLFPHWPQEDVSVGHVSNGVHMPTWDSAAAEELWRKACGKDRWLGTSDKLEQDLRRVSDETLWQFRLATSKSLVEYARERLARHYAAGTLSETVKEAKPLFDRNVLTQGFPRRFATYKISNLLLHDPERLLRLLSNPQRPLQLIVAGKAHPMDLAGQTLMRKWIQFLRRPEVRPRASFLSDYDIHLTERPVQGVDVWLNTPRRPWEACGRSGMKVLVNGGINLSELDGCWAETLVPDLGWALGDGQAHDSHPSWDGAETEALYERLEREVIPEFYNRNEKGLPAWIARMRESMARLTPRFSANRAVCEYTDQHYLPAAVAHRSVLVPAVVENRGGSDSLRLVGVLETSCQKGAAMKGSYRKQDRRPSCVRRPAYRMEFTPAGTDGLDPSVRLELPLRQLTGALRAAVHELAGQSGSPWRPLIAEEVEQRAGRRYAHQVAKEGDSTKPGRHGRREPGGKCMAHRIGSSTGGVQTATWSGRARRCRWNVRGCATARAGRWPLERYRRFQGDGARQRDVARRVLAGVSTRQ